MDKNEEIYRWVAAWIKGELTPEDEAELACWLKQDPKNQEWFDTFTTRENLKGALSLYASFHTAKRWEELERYCRITNRRKIHPGYWRYVAAVVILFIIGGIGFLYFVPDTRKEMTLAAVGPKEFHQQAVLVLENGKELVLNGIKDTCLSLGQGERLSGAFGLSPGFFTAGNSRRMAYPANPERRRIYIGIGGWEPGMVE